MADKKTPLLDLDNLVDSQYVAIDGKSYSMRNQDEVSPLEAHRFKKWGARLDTLINKDDLTEAEEAELEDIPKRLCRQVINAPADVIEALQDWQRMKILATFTKLLQADKQAGATALIDRVEKIVDRMQARETKTGDALSPGSSDSTAENQ